FLCAFESKESAVAVPLVVALVTVGAVRKSSTGGLSRAARAGGGADWTTPSARDSGNLLCAQPSPLGGGDYWGRARFAAGLLLVAFVLSVATLTILFYRGESTVGIRAVSTVSPISYFLTETRVIYTYMRILAFPFSQSLEYDFPWVQHFGIQQVAQIVG